MTGETLREKEHKELARWKKQAQRRPMAGYLAIMIVILGIVRMLDEFVTSAPTSVQSDIVQEFFVEGMGMSFEQGLATISLISTALLLCSILAVFFVALCDKMGRRVILIVSTVGMTAGMLVCCISTSLAVHIVGRAIITFFVATDVHQIYVLEIAPDDKRAMYIQITTVFGQAGVMLVGLVRMLFTQGGELNWRGVFLLPCVIGVAACVGVMAFARETDAFLNARIAHLSKTPEQRAAEAEAAKRNKAEAETKSGILPAAKYVFTHKQTRNLLLATMPCCFATMAFATYYETIMTSSGMGTDQVSVALFVYPLFASAVALLVGYVTDRFGRKPAGVMTAILTFVSLFLFIFAAQGQMPPVVVGMLLGIETGAFWRYNELLTLTMRESVPTVIRASAGSVTGLISVMLSLVSGILISIFLAVFPVGSVCMVWGAVTIGLSALLYVLGVQETKGTKLEEVS